MFGSMLSSLISDITTFNTNNKLSKVVLSKRRRIVGKDDQNPLMTTTTTTRTEQTKANKKRVRFETEPLVFYDDDDGYGEKSYGRIVKNGENNYNLHHDHDDDQLKVKILMTKEEASRLLAKCKDGGRLEFRDLAHELMQIPVSRVNLVSSRDGNCNFVWQQGIVDHKEL